MTNSIIDDEDDSDGGSIISDLSNGKPDEILEGANENTGNNNSLAVQTTRRRSKAASIKGESVENIYNSVVESVKKTLDENDVVDIELTFKASSVRGGIPIISNKRDTSVVEIRLATRISGNPKVLK